MCRVAVLAVIMAGVAAVALLVGTAQLHGATGTTVLLDMRHVKPAPARTEMLWFGPGISDELNRMIKLGKVRERGRVRGD
jgi:hypothetical protein